MNKNNVAALTIAVKDAKVRKREADAAIKHRDEALKHLTSLLGGGDMLAAIHNAEKRIGQLLTDDA